MDWKNAIVGIVKLLVVAGIVFLIFNPIIWITCGWWIIKILFIGVLASCVARIVFKKSIKDIIMDFFGGGDI